MPGAGHRSVSLPDDLLAKVERFVESNDEGYRSVAEVVSVAIRQFLREEERTRQAASPELPPEARVGETGRRLLDDLKRGRERGKAGRG